jgi:cytochrome P450
VADTTNFDALDFFTDPSLADDPYPFFEHVRAKGPIAPEQHHKTLLVTGYDEIWEVYRNTEDFSSVNSVIGPFVTLPPIEGELQDISEWIEQQRPTIPMNEHFVTMDPPDHTKHRSLMMRLLTPKRLKENEEFMWRAADRQLDTFLSTGTCEFIKDYSQPFALLAVADVLGVPEEDHPLLLQKLGNTSPGGLSEEHKPGGLSEEHKEWEETNSLVFLDEYFVKYIEERRAEPRNDVLTVLANTDFPDGSVPPVLDVVRPATFLFAAGQETTARLLGTALQVLGDDLELQERIRGDREVIPNFIEECLRIESPVKCDFRLALRDTKIGDVEVPVGTAVALLNGAANRDPIRFPDPARFDPYRENAREHMAFGRGVHSCPGGPLARAEAQISINRVLDRMANIRISEEHHGPAGNRRYHYEPTYVLRGLTALHLEFDPVDA